MNSPLLSLEPASVWQLFDAIRQIPRPPRREQRVGAWVMAWAAERGFAVKADSAGNMVISVPASVGAEAAPTVILQAHLDMVCEKNRDSAHDFERDPIAVEIEDGWVKALGTTLGADNGIGMALAMAAASDPECRHPALELLMTVEEEIGLLGAQAFDPSLASGRLLINLDSEEDAAITIGCAGALAIAVKVGLIRAPFAGAAWELRVRGLTGGHSGVEIHTGRGNAIQIAARILVAAGRAGIDFGVAAISGGDKPNAIPRECFAELRLPAGQESRFTALIAELLPSLRAELAATDPRLEVELHPISASSVGAVWGDVRDRFFMTLDACPHGPQRMSNELPGLVETSCNLAILKFVAEPGADAEVLVGIRSSVNSALEMMAQKLESLFGLLPASTSRTRGYPGWKPDPAARLVQLTVACHHELFGADPEVKAIHAGLECGVLGEKLGGLQAVSFGPDIKGAHSPTERVKIASVARNYSWLKALLALLAKE